MSIIYPDAGTIAVLGANALQSKDQIGYLPEERGLYRKMKIAQFLRYIARLKGLSRKDADHKIAWWLERLELPDVLGRRCEELSKGQQQKLQFITAVVHDPELIILDEPFSGLDPVNAALLGTIIKELNENGRTIIFSTHVLHQAEELCDRVFLINHGIKLLDDPMDVVHDRYNPRVLSMELIAPRDIEVPMIHGVRNMTRKGTTHEFHLDQDAKIQPIMNWLTSNLEIRSLELRRPTLNDIFVELVKGTESP